MAVDSTGNAYVLEAGTTSGTADLLLLPAGGGAPQIVIPQGAGLLTPSALAIDSAGNYFIADATHGTVSRFGADGTINTSYVTGLDTPTAIYVDGFDNLFIAQAGATHNVIEVYAAGSRRIISSSFVSPSGLFLDLNGILYIADAGGHLVYAVDKSGILHEVAGNGTTTTTVPGQATGTALLAPSSLSVDAAGDLYIADAAANRVYTVYASTTQQWQQHRRRSSAPAPLAKPATAASAISRRSAIPSASPLMAAAISSSSTAATAQSARSPTRTRPSPSAPSWSAKAPPSCCRASATSAPTTSTSPLPFSTSDSHFTIDSNSTTCGTTIIAGSTCNVGFIFTPTANGPLTASITLVSNSYNSPQPLQLTGTGHLVSPLQFTLPAQTEVYGQPFPEIVQVTNGNPAPTGTITFSIGKQVLCTLTATLGATTTCNAPNSGLPVGTYTVTFSYTGDSNYAAASSTVILTVTPAPLTVTVNNASRVYGAANPTFTGTLTGVLPGDTVLVSYSTTATVSAQSETTPSSRLSLRPAAPTSLTTPSPTRLEPSPSPRRLSPSTSTTPRVSMVRRILTFTGTVPRGALNGDTFDHYLLHHRHCHLARRNLSDQRDRLRPVFRELPRHRELWNPHRHASTAHGHGRQCDPALRRS